VSIYGSDEDKALTMQGLESVAGGLRGRVGRALRLRIAPHITFKHDDSIARASRIETLLASLKPAPEAKGGDPDPKDGGR
jgi:ribosome-binding factor A